MEINYKRCKDVVMRLNKFLARQNDLASVEYPTSIKFCSNEYILYMFYSCLLDYGMRSKIYHKNLIDTYEKYPNIFNPSYVIKMSDDDLHDIIVNNIHPRYPNVATKKWQHLSKELIKYNSISSQLKEISNYDQLNKFIKNIKGYGQKTGGLLIRVLYDSNICSFKEIIKSIPIDRHDIEISYLTGVLNTPNPSSDEIIKLSDAYVSIGKDLNINPSNIDKYLWEIGTVFCNKKECKGCPLNDICIKIK